MHWPAIIVLTAIAVSLQTIVAPRLEISGTRPDWLLVLVGFICLYGDPRRSVPAAWFVGLCGDLMSVERLGLMSLTYGLAALLMYAARDYVFRYSVWTQLGVTFVLSVLVRIAWGIYGAALYRWDDAGYAGASVQILLGSAYTAIWAPVAHGAMLRAGALLGVARARRGPMGLTELA